MSLAKTDLNKQNKIKSYSKTYEPHFTRDNYYAYIENQLSKFANFIAQSHSQTQNVNHLLQHAKLQDDRIKNIEKQLQTLNITNYQCFTRNDKYGIDSSIIKSVQERIHALESNKTKRQVEKSANEFDVPKQIKKIKKAITEIESKLEFFDYKQQGSNRKHLQKQIAKTVNMKSKQNSKQKKDMGSMAKTMQQNITHDLTMVIQDKIQQIKENYENDKRNSFKHLQQQLKEYFMQKFDKLKRIIKKHNSKVKGMDEMQQIQRKQLKSKSNRSKIHQTTMYQTIISKDSPRNTQHQKYKISQIYQQKPNLSKLNSETFRQVNPEIPKPKKTKKSKSKSKSIQKKLKDYTQVDRLCRKRVKSDKSRISSRQKSRSQSTHRKIQGLEQSYKRIKKQPM